MSGWAINRISISIMVLALDNCDKRIIMPHDVKASISSRPETVALRSGTHPRIHYSMEVCAFWNGCTACLLWEEGAASPNGWSRKTKEVQQNKEFTQDRVRNKM